MVLQTQLREKTMNLLKKWYVQLALALFAAAVFTVVLILMDINETGEELFKTNVPGTLAEFQTVTFELEASELTHVLVLNPDIESGWGEPDVFLEARLSDPGGNVLLTITRDRLFGGDDDLDIGSRSYRQKFEFQALESGEYTLEIMTFTEHVEAIYITIGRRASE
jgi:hypothetical protein